MAKQKTKYSGGYVLFLIVLGSIGTISVAVFHFKNSDAGVLGGTIVALLSIIQLSFIAGDSPRVNQNKV